MIEHISDTRLMFFLQKELRKSPELTKMFCSVAYCHVRLAKPLGYQPGVFVLTNEDQAKYFGLATCKSSWICPVCSAKQMAKYATEISCALDALAQPKYNQLACMITFTVPHTSGMSCEEVTEIVYNTWKDFMVHGNKRLNVGYYVNETNKFKHNQKKVLVKSKRKLKDPFSSFCEEFNCTHRVRVCEYTWGEHGWHPHLHTLFWVDANKINNVISWEKILNDRWMTLAKRNTLKIWNKKFPDKKEDNEKRLDIMYSKLKRPEDGCYISKDKNGKVIIQKSSMYICGWGADKELTGNVRNKARTEGHYTPYQLLEMAANGDKEKFELFIEYAKATKLKRHNKINFSVHSGIKKIIAQWKLTNTYREVLKKKAMQEKNAHGKWEMVCWFSEKQWYIISLIEMQEKIPLKYAILEIAKKTKSKTIIDFLLHPLKIKSNPLNKHANYKEVERYFKESA